MATLVAFVHNNALDDLRREKGDNLWILGCAGFTRSCAAIQNLANEEKLSWLTVCDPGMHFVFKIGLVRVRVSKGDEDGVPNQNTLTGVVQEVEQYRATYLDGFFDPEYSDCVWRFVILKHRNGNVDRVELQLIRAKSAEAVRSWIMPLAADITGLLPWAKEATYVKVPPADVKDISFGKPKTGRSKEKNG
jgi:hypothetical protein